MENNAQYRQRVLTELAAIGFSRVGDCMKTDGNALQVKKLAGKAGAAIASIEQTNTGIKVKFYDKLKALTLLGQCMGMFGGEDARQREEETNLLECILQATEGTVDICDIPEIQQAADAGDDLVEQDGA